MKFSSKVLSLSFVSLLALYPSQDVWAGKNSKPPSEKGERKITIRRIFGLEKKSDKSPTPQASTDSSSATSSTSVSIAEPLSPSDGAVASTSVRFAEPFSPRTERAVASTSVSIAGPLPTTTERAVASTAMTAAPPLREPASRESGTATKALRVPEELSFDMLTAIFNAPLVFHTQDIHGNPLILPVKDPENPQQNCAEYTAIKGLKRTAGQKVEIAAGLLASHKIADEDNSVEKFKGLLQKYPGMRAIRSQPDSAILRSLNTLGDNFKSVMGFYLLYDVSGAPILKVDDSGNPIPHSNKFIVSFYQHR